MFLPPKQEHMRLLLLTRGFTLGGDDQGPPRNRAMLEHCSALVISSPHNQGDNAHLIHTWIKHITCVSPHLSLMVYMVNSNIICNANGSASGLLPSNKGHRPNDVIGISSDTMSTAVKGDRTLR